MEVSAGVGGSRVQCMEVYFLSKISEGIQMYLLDREGESELHRKAEDHSATE